ncbi:MAG: MFS transporter [Anaerolineae bacterium]|nr:MFS transporter [Anaerolineae bacterium]
MLVIEFLDEFAYSGLEAARPLIRDSFLLNYVEVGLITTLPVLIAIVIEPIIGLYANSSKRQTLMVWGTVAFGIGLILQGVASSFPLFLLGAVLQAPASGVFVNLAQASLMDDAPQRRENRMAWWTLSGSVATLVGPLMLSLMVLLGAGWRGFFLLAGVIALLVAFFVARMPANRALRSADNEEDDPTLRQSLQQAGALLRRLDVWRWLVLLEFSDLMLDVLFGLLALYMVDVVGVSQEQATVAITVWVGVGLIGDFMLIPLLEKVKGLRYLRFSAAVELVLFPAFLLTEPYTLKLVLLGIMGLFNAGWYAILQGKLYDALGDQSGAVLIVGNAAGIVTALLPIFLGAIAEAFGLNAAMWCLLAGPIALTIGLWRVRRDPTGE